MSAPVAPATAVEPELEQKQAATTTASNETEETTLPDTQQQSNVERIPQILTFLTSKNERRVIAENLKELLDLLSSGTKEVSDKVFDDGGVECLMDVLSVDDQQIQLDALACLVPVCSRGSHFEQVFLLGPIRKLIPKLIPLLGSPWDNVRSETYHLLGEIAGNCCTHRDEILSAGIVPCLLESPTIFESATPAETVQRFSKLIAQLCNHKPCPAFEIVEPLIPFVKQFLSHPNAEVRANACWAVSYLTEGPPARIHAVQQYQVMGDVFALLRSGNPLFALPAIRTFGNFSATNPEMTQIIIDQGVPQLLPPFLNLSVAANIRKEVCWMISNICAGFENQVQAVQDAGLFPLVIANIVAPEFEVQREAVLVIANGTATATIERAGYLPETCDVLPSLCHVLGSKDARICGMTLEAIESILLFGDFLRQSNNGVNPYVVRIEEVKGIGNIFVLCDNETASVSARAQKLMDTYFPGFEGEEEENLEGEGYDEGKHEFKDDDDVQFNI